jgi:hypothetical protein
MQRVRRIMLYLIPTKCITKKCSLFIILLLPLFICIFSPPSYLLFYAFPLPAPFISSPLYPPFPHLPSYFASSISNAESLLSPHRDSSHLPPLSLLSPSFLGVVVIFFLISFSVLTRIVLPSVPKKIQVAAEMKVVEII